MAVPQGCPAVGDIEEGIAPRHASADDRSVSTSHARTCRVLGGRRPSCDPNPQQEM
jgi:hypothetical protein